MEAQAFIYATLSTLTLCLICTRQTPPYLTLFLLKSKIRMGKNFIIGTVYRPPSANFHEFLESFQQLLHRVTRDNKMCDIMGDFNLDLLKTDLHSATNEFINALFSHFLYPLISRPTRLTSNSATLIDNIFTNNISASCDNGLIINYLSDHLPIFTLCYTDAHSSTIKPKEVLPFATSLVRILMHLTTFCVNSIGIL